MYFHRGNNEIKVDYKPIDIFKAYKKETGNPSKVSQATYFKILKDFYKELFDLLIYDSFEYVMPFRLGYLRIAKLSSKPKIKNGKLDKKSLRPDWKSTLELWEKEYGKISKEELKKIPNKPLVYHTNKHTSGYRFKFLWDRLTCTIKNAKMYTLQINRETKRKLAKVAKDPYTKIDFYKI